MAVVYTDFPSRLKVAFCCCCNF